MTHEMKRQEIQQALDYLMAEGFVVKIDDKYRLKTEIENQKELEVLLEN